MADDEAPAHTNTLSVQDLQGWLKEEIRDCDKAHELRVKEATEFVTAYAAGKLSPSEAMQRLLQYDRRWGEALYGATASPGISDEQILKAIDLACDEALYPEKRSHTGRLEKTDKGISEPSL